MGETHTNQVMLVYGRSGTGKTHFGSTFPRPILFLDINERGLDTIRDQDDIDVIHCKTWEIFDEVFWDLRKGSKYKSVVIDQVTNLQDLGMAEIRRRAKKTESELFTKKNWGELSGLLKQAISNYKDLVEDYNLCFLAHERIFGGGEEEDDALDPSVGARVIPSVGTFLDGAVDAIGSTFIREKTEKKGAKKTRSVDYCMRIGPHAYYITKVRRPPGAGPVPGIITNPSFTQLTDLIAGKSVAKKKVTKKRKKIRSK